MDEWVTKHEDWPAGYPLRDIHLVFEEWFETGHVRVSVRGDRSYAIELEGAIRSSGPRYAEKRERARGLYTGTKGGFDFLPRFGEFGSLQYLMRNRGGGPPLPAFPPCPAAGDDGSGTYHAAMTLLVEYPAPQVLRSWWTSPTCPGFPRAIAGEAWDLVERVTAGSVTRPSWHASPSRSPSSATAQSPAPQPGCPGFGGRIHGKSSCVRLELATGQVTPLDQRVDGLAVASLRCDATGHAGGHTIALKCAVDRARGSEQTKRAVISAAIDGGRSVVIDRHEGYWDFIHASAKPAEGALDLTIDYGVND